LVTATYKDPPYAEGRVAVIVGIERPAAEVTSGNRADEMGYGTQRLGCRPSYSTITMAGAQPRNETGQDDCRIRNKVQRIGQ